MSSFFRLPYDETIAKTDWDSATAAKRSASCRTSTASVDTDAVVGKIPPDEDLNITQQQSFTNEMDKVDLYEETSSEKSSKKIHKGMKETLCAPGIAGPPSPLVEAIEGTKKESMASEQQIEPLNVDMDFLAAQNLGELNDPNDDLGLDERNFAESHMTPEEARMYSIHSQVILELLCAGEEIETVLAKRARYIGKTLIDLLDRRCAAAKKMGNNMVAQSAELISQRLKAELVRSGCSPGLQLLDECLQILTPLFDVRGDPERVDRRDLKDLITHRLSRAFRGPELPSDVVNLSFAIAKFNSSNRAVDKAMNLDRVVEKYVTKESFLQEVIPFYVETRAVRTWEMDYHYQVEALAKVKIPTIEDHARRSRLATSIINKRRVLERQIAVLHEVSLIIEIAKTL